MYYFDWFPWGPLKIWIKLSGKPPPGLYILFINFKCFVFAAAKIGFKVESWKADIGGDTEVLI